MEMRVNILRSLFGSGPNITQIDVAATRAALDDPNVQIIDCRERREWQSGHIAGSQLMPLSSIDKQMDRLDKNRPVIVLCRSGHRSSMAARQLANAGFTDVKSMKGGVIAWKRAGLELDS